jgi:hypothetical protein
MAELEKTQTRYLIVGMLISFFISFILWHLWNMIFGRKKVEIKTTSPTMVKKRQ